MMLAGAIAALAFVAPPDVRAAATVEAGRKQFETRCAGCHGQDGMGGERAPAIARLGRHRRSEPELRDLIHNGIPDAGMPPFQIPEPQLTQLIAFVRSRAAPAAESEVPGDPAAGRAFFYGAGKCGTCHMIRGRGGRNGPDLTRAGRELTLTEIEQSLRDPNTRRVPGYQVATARLRSGAELRGFLRNESNFDLQLRDFEGRLHLLRRDDVALVARDPVSYMPALKATPAETRDLIAFLVRGGPDSSGLAGWNPQPRDPKPGEWPTYHGRTDGNRYSTLAQIAPANVAGLAPRWVFPLAGTRNIEVTPVVVDEIMYVTLANQAFALDARSGRQIWHYGRPVTKGLVGDAAGSINRGVAVLGDRVFLVTDNAHLLALDSITGALVWETVMADSARHYGATSAPLVVGNLVISGTSGGDEGIRGFVAAYKASTGERVWRFWTAPLPGEPAAKTWIGRAIEHPCASAWLTGSYDPDTGLLYWPTGNPCPDFNGDERKGDNLYSDAALALNPETGELKWHFQFTPHDLHDWDSTETLMAVDADYGGRPRKLLLHADRNGFFYVLDRATGEFLNAWPFVKKLTWAKGIAKDGRPILAPGNEPSIQGTRVCPSMDGATNWMSNAYLPEIGLFYVMALEKCSIYSKSSAWWRPGESFYGGGARNVPGEEAQKVLRAIDIRTGRIAWEYPQAGNAWSWGGILGTSTGLVFFGEDSGAFAALDAATGKLLWHTQLNTHWKASPMTYLAGGKQYVAVATDFGIVAFALP